MFSFSIWISIISELIPVSEKIEISPIPIIIIIIRIIFLLKELPNNVKITLIHFNFGPPGFHNYKQMKILEINSKIEKFDYIHFIKIIDT